MDKLTVPVLLERTLTDRIIRSIYPAVRKIVPYHSPLVPNLMVREARSAVEKEDDLNICQEVEEYLAQFVTPTRYNPRYYNGCLKGSAKSNV